MPIIHFLGLPGAGKTTAINRLVSEQSRWTKFYIGDFVRQEIAQQTELGRTCEKLLEGGKVLPAELCVEIIKHGLRMMSGQNVIIDGFPRSAEQAECYVRNIGKPDLTICLDVPKSVAAERVLRRTQTESRVDDTPQNIRDRQAHADEQVEPGLSIYQKHNFYIERLDATGDVDECYESILSTLRRYHFDVM
ncbi:adenylate kinase [Giardia muris]|uniref:Adenylate kinase n=1 Tax=Giardia muris TaxID=5742 RepID=A0A4Z1T103_GIAMU|nr:adenylate kinase [Giardia muris]|eukprot:TNJ30655.1 adenylate kinase [Giardia muris]